MIRIKQKGNAYCKTVSRKIEEENGKTGRGEATVIVMAHLVNIHNSVRGLHST